jgi:hypothetical protein
MSACAATARAWNEIRENLARLGTRRARPKGNRWTIIKRSQQRVAPSPDAASALHPLGAGRCYDLRQTLNWMDPTFNPLRLRRFRRRARLSASLP